MDVSRQFKILREVLLALQLIHEQGCVHLDIKPDNIFLKDDMYKLGDFGTATLRNEINAKTGKPMDVEEGDSRYMARDMLDGAPDDLTKCDIFSLGIAFGLGVGIRKYGVGGARYRRANHALSRSDQPGSCCSSKLRPSA